MNNVIVDSLIEKFPKLSNAKAKLAAMKPETYCIHRGWGFGKIKAYDPVRNKLIIDFEGGRSGHAMDPAFCVEKLELLPENHILVRQRTEPKVVEEMVKKQPTELIIDILSKANNRQLTTPEIERILRLLLGDSLYKKWWSKTKKLLLKDPRIAIPDKKTAPYILREEPVNPEYEILEEFQHARTAKHKILLAEKLYKLADSVENITEDLPNIFASLTDCLQNARNLSEAERLHGIWVRNDLARHIHKDIETIEPTSSSCIKANETRLHILATELPSTYQKRFLDLLARVYPDKHEAILLDQLRNSTGRYSNECVNFLIDRGMSQQVAESLKRWLSEQNLKSPLIYWVIKNRNSKKYQKLVKDIISPSLLNAAFTAIENEALHSENTRRIPLAELIFDDTELIQDTLIEATVENAQDLAQALLLNQGFGDLEKKSIFARFIKAFPDTQNLLSSKEVHSEAKDLVVSQLSIDLRKSEYEELIKIKIPENKKAIAIAREHGDLRENAEYKMAKEEQQTLMARKSLMEREFVQARITDFSEASDDIVGIGSVVTLVHIDSSRTQTYTILGAWDSDPERNILSYKTLLAQRLLGKKQGDRVKTPIDDTEEEWSIQNLRRWVDCNSVSSGT